MQNDSLSPKREDSEVIFGDWSQCEKISEMKPPKGYGQTIQINKLVKKLTKASTFRINHP